MRKRLGGASSSPSPAERPESTVSPGPTPAALDESETMSIVERVREFTKSDTAKVLWCVVGVVGTLMVYGVMQERIMKQPYGPDEEFFQHSLFIVLCNRLLAMAMATTILVSSGKSMAPVAPLSSYAAVSLSNVVATGCQYEALKYVSFPLQTLAKSAKMIPVMIWGTAIMQKVYGAKDYAIALLVTAGCAIFVLYGGSHKPHKQVDSTFWGILLMIGYLGFDGFTSTFQDKLFKGYKMDTFNQILYISMWSALLSVIGLNYNIVYAIQFVIKYPTCMFHILLLSASASISQFFISYTIKTFGALVFATIMTTRQLLSILLSSALYGPPLTAGQFGGTVLVFSALYYKAYAGKKHEAKGAPGSEAEGREGKETDPLLMDGGAQGTQQSGEQNPQMLLPVDAVNKV